VLYEPPLLGPVAPETLVRLHAALAAGDADGVVSVALGEVVGAASNPDLPAEARAQMLASMRQSPVWAGALRNVRGIPAEVESYSTYRFDPAEFRDFATGCALARQCQRSGDAAMDGRAPGSPSLQPDDAVGRAGP
jgi:hypothetical protein